MNRPRLSKSGIEYLDYVWNFYSGCLNWKNGICPLGENCWAKKIAKRFPAHYPNGFEPTWYPEAFLSPLSLKKPSIIGVAFMGDLFGDWVDPDKKFHSVMPSGKASITMSLKGWIFTTIKQCPQHTFLFLTKNPKQLVNWGKFPENCWVGVTATGNFMFWKALSYLKDIKATVKYLSIEPYLEAIKPMLSPFTNFELSYEVGINKIAQCLNLAGITWVIIGLQTPYSPKTAPKIEHIEEIVRACDKAGVKVFLKDNLDNLLPEKDPLFRKNQYELRQELPDGTI